MTVRRGFSNLSWSCEYPFSANSSTGRDGGKGCLLASSLQIHILLADGDGKGVVAGVLFSRKPKIDDPKKRGKRNLVANVMLGI